MKKYTKLILGAGIALLVLAVAITSILLLGKPKVQGADFENLFVKGFAGITTNEKELKNIDYVSSQHIDVNEGETIWYGPCDPAQNIHMATFDSKGDPVASEKRSKPLQPSDTFSNNLVIYKYEVPEGVAKLCFTAKTSLADVYTVSKTELTCLNWVAYWKLKEVNTADYVGENQFYEVKKGDKVYFGAITEEGANSIAVYDKTAKRVGKINKSDLKLIDSFGKKYGIYCYTVTDSNVKYIQTPSEEVSDSYYGSVYVKKGEKSSEEQVVDTIIATFGVQRPLSNTVDVLKDKRVLFLGDSITLGKKDEKNIYDCAGWAGRVGYFCEMDVETRDAVEKADGKYDYVIIQGLYNYVEKKADVQAFSEKLKAQLTEVRDNYPKAMLGYVVDYKIERMVDLTPYVEAAIKVCEELEIPYLDLYNDQSFVVELEDGVHPTSAGYDSMYMRIATWMASLNGEDKGEDSVTTKARIMSYNVFWSATDEVPNKGITIKDRVKKVQENILTCDPDIFVLQEVSTGAKSWIPILREFIEENNYGFYGFGHYKERGIDTTSGIDTSNSTGSESEMTPILWKKDKYECVEKGHYWASSTPTVAGSLWKDVPSSHSSGRLYPRCVNWLVLKDKETQEHIMIVSYHADPYTEKVRKLSAQLVMEKTAEVSAKYHNLAVVMAGDWNMERDQPTYGVITGNGYVDSQKVAEKTSPQATFSAWKRSVGAFAEADYIFVNHNVYVSEFQVYNNMDPEQMGVFVSDHCPVIADIEF